MPTQKNGGVMDGQPVLGYVACSLCGRSSLSGERYGSGEKDWNLDPVTCPECFSKPENQPIIQHAQEAKKRERRKRTRERRGFPWGDAFSGWYGGTEMIPVLILLAIVGISWEIFRRIKLVWSMAIYGLMVAAIEIPINLQLLEDASARGALLLSFFGIGLLGLMFLIQGLEHPSGMSRGTPLSASCGNVF